MNNANPTTETHRLSVAYLLWIFGFSGAHRFYVGRPSSGTWYFLTFGFFGIGWILDLFLLPGMVQQANVRFHSGEKSYNVAWILLTFFGVFGTHRFYLGKWKSGLLYVFTGGLLTFGILYDFWKINTMVDEANVS